MSAESRTSLEIKDLQLVQAIDECGGVSKAGQHLHVSQSAVSHHLRRIERRLGVDLFDRTGRRLEITRAGRQLVDLSREITGRLTEVERSIRSSRVDRVRLSTQCYTAYHWLPPLLEDLTGAQRDIDVQIVVDATRDPIAAIERGEVDLGICHTLPDDTTDWVTRTLFDDHFVVVMSPSHPLAAKKRVRPRDLLDETLLINDLPIERIAEFGDELFGDGPDRPSRMKRLPLTEAIIELVKRGHGVSILSRWAATSYAGVTTRPFAGVTIKRRWRAVYRKRAPMRESMELIAEALKRRGVAR
jgi:LysR family transcriptional regulator for metE and metH